MGYCNWSSTTSALTFTCGHDNLNFLYIFYVSFPNLLYTLQLTSSWTSLIMAEQNFKLQIYCNFSHSISWPCRNDYLKSFSCILFKFVMHVTNRQFSGKFDNNWKKFKLQIYFDFLHFMSIIVGMITCNFSHLSCSNLLCMLLKAVLVQARYGWNMHIMSCLISDPVLRMSLTWKIGLSSLYGAF